MSQESSLREQVRDALTTVLAAECPLDRVLAGDGASPRVALTLWPVLAELGYLGAALPESDGGMGLGAGDLAGAYEALGRAVAPVPFLPAMLFADALVADGSPQQRARYLPQLATGVLRPAVACPSLPGALRLSRAPNGDLQLDGRLEHVLDGGQAAVLLVFAQDHEGAEHAILLEAGDDGVRITAQELVDASRGFAVIELAAARIPDDRLLPADAEALRRRLMSHAALALACDCLGGAQHAFEITVDYLKVRSQFGRPIGAFQALKHRCADLKARLEMAQALAADAARSAGAPDFDHKASLAKAIIGDLYARAAGEAVQLHGGIGYTAEHPCHLFLKRAKLNQAIFGSSALHRDRAFAQLVS